MAAAVAAENHRDEWGLTWYLQCGIYASIPTWTHPQNLLAAAQALSLKIFPHYPSNDQEDCPNQHNNSHNLCNETGHLVVNLMERQWRLRQHD